MCIDKKCIIDSAACGCCCFCNCNYICYDCYDTRNFLVPGAADMYHYTSSDVRKKFVCFPCKKIWKLCTSK
jgi:hypothetical protein